MITLERLQEIDAALCPFTEEWPNHVPWLIWAARTEISDGLFDRDNYPSTNEALETFPGLAYRFEADELVEWAAWRDEQDDYADRLADDDRELA